MKHCSSCGAPIIWATTPNNRRCPVDAAPLRSVYHLDDRLSLERPARAVYQSHFATCPNASNHSKKKT